ncbi:MAG: ABC transporter permease [Anaerolineae bacterium]|nr:ABC transporter permease [Anaerolineae bacterium]
MNNMDVLNVISEIVRLTLLFATPFLFASLGEVFAQRSGVLNLGVEGIMLMGAFFAIYTVADKGLGLSPWIGLLVAGLVGGLMGLAMAIVSVTLKAEQGISGIGFTLFGQGMSSLLFKVMAGGVITVRGFQRIDIPLLSEIPFFGKALFQQNILVYIAFALVPISVWVLNRTNFGLQVRAVGQNPEAADSVGVSVARVRYVTITLGGIMAGLAGASLSIAITNVFQENMTAGAGFIAVALVYFGAWSPWRVMAGALLFSAASILQNFVQIFNSMQGITINIPPNILIMVPYVLIIVVLVFARERKRVEPAALTKPFEREG